MRAYLAGVTVISGLLALACGGGAEPDLEDPVLREPEPTDGDAPAYLDTDLSPALRAAMMSPVPLIHGTEVTLSHGNAFPPSLRT